MSNKNHLEIIKMGAEKWNSWRKENTHETPDFSWANLPEMDLQNYNFKNANLKLAFCKSCNFTGANFENANCSNANFSGANLEGALIKNAILKNSNLSDCNFRLVNLEGSNLQGADLSGSKKLKIDQISRVSTLYEAKLSERITEKLLAISPHLFRKSNQ